MLPVEFGTMLFRCFDFFGHKLEQVVGKKWPALRYLKSLSHNIWMPSYPFLGCNKDPQPTCWKPPTEVPPLLRWRSTVAPRLWLGLRKSHSAPGRPQTRRPWAKHGWKVNCIRWRSFIYVWHFLRLNCYGLCFWILGRCSNGHMFQWDPSEFQHAIKRKQVSECQEGQWKKSERLELTGVFCCLRSSWALTHCLCMVASSWNTELGPKTGAHTEPQEIQGIYPIPKTGQKIQNSHLMQFAFLWGAGDLELKQQQPWGLATPPLQEVPAVHGPRSGPPFSKVTPDGQRPERWPRSSPWCTALPPRCWSNALKTPLLLVDQNPWWSEWSSSRSSHQTSGSSIILLYLLSKKLRVPVVSLASNYPYSDHSWFEFPQQVTPPRFRLVTWLDIFGLPSFQLQMAPPHRPGGGFPESASCFWGHPHRFTSQPWSIFPSLSLRESIYDEVNSSAQFWAEVLLVPSDMPLVQPVQIHRILKFKVLFYASQFQAV